MTIRVFESLTPRIAPTAWVDDAALVIGDVSIGDDSSVWPMAVLRGDINAITIGARSNIQDGTIAHVNHESPYNPGSTVTVGDDVTVGHRAILHGCTIESVCLIGMGAVIMDAAVVSEGCVVAAGALIPPGKILQPGCLYVGAPAQKVRKLGPEVLEQLRYSARHYVENKNRHRRQTATIASR